MHIVRLDHLVLTVADIDATCDFYTRVLGMTLVTFGENRRALIFGAQKIILHQHGREFEPKAHSPVPGSADLCLIAGVTLAEAEAHIRAAGVEIIEGPVRRTGAAGPIWCLYLRDPDQNMIEVSSYD